MSGTKLGCGEGGCGACTVMLSRYDAVLGKPRHYSANACLTPLCALDGYHVTTVEGIGSMRTGLHPVQQRIAELHGSQCGFCTPGIVMSLYTILRSNPSATPHEIEEALDGNLCRCTGYRPIIDAAKSLSNIPQGGCCGGGGAGGGCPCKDFTPQDGSGASLVTSCSEAIIEAHPGVAESMRSKNLSEPIFPPRLTRYTPSEMLIQNDAVSVTWYQPTTLASLLEFRAAHPESRVVVGNTEVGIEVKFKAMSYSHLVNPSHVPECTLLALEEGGLRVGSAVSLETLKGFVSSLTATCDPAEQYKYRALTAIRHMLNWFASTQIRNVACIGGNIATASPISDMNPLLLALKATLRVASLSGTRDVCITEFFKGYRKVDLQPGEVLQDVFIPFVEKFEFIVPLKQAKRREDDISIVTSGAGTEREGDDVVCILYAVLCNL